MSTGTTTQPAAATAAPAAATTAPTATTAPATSPASHKDMNHHLNAAFADLDKGFEDIVGEVKKLHAIHTAALDKQYNDFMAGARKDLAAHKDGQAAAPGQGQDEHAKGLERAAGAYRAKLQQHKKELAERWGGGAGAARGGGGAAATATDSAAVPASGSTAAAA